MYHLLPVQNVLLNVAAGDSNFNNCGNGSCEIIAGDGGYGDSNTYHGGEFNSVGDSIEWIAVDCDFG